MNNLIKASRLLVGIGTPLVYSVGAVIIGLILPRVEAAFLPNLTVRVSIGSAIAILSAIASGILPLTGLVFSLAFVMVQFSATAYSPRLVSGMAITNNLGLWLRLRVSRIGSRQHEDPYCGGGRW